MARQHTAASRESKDGITITIVAELTTRTIDLGAVNLMYAIILHTGRHVSVDPEIRDTTLAECVRQGSSAVRFRKQTAADCRRRRSTMLNCIYLSNYLTIYPQISVDGFDRRAHSILPLGFGQKKPAIWEESCDGVVAGSTSNC